MIAFLGHMLMERLPAVSMYSYCLLVSLMELIVSHARF